MSDHQAMYVRLPIELHQAVKDRAAADDRTMAQTIRQALRYYLNTTRSLLVAEPPKAKPEDAVKVDD